MTDSRAETPPCGSWRVTAYVQGYEETVRWCERKAGPCPYPNTDASSAHAANRTCAVLEAAESGREAQPDD